MNNYNVIFVYDAFVVTVFQVAEYEDAAIAGALQDLVDELGDQMKSYNSVEAEEA